MSRPASIGESTGAGPLTWLARGIVAFVFIAAAAGKIELPHKFVEEIQNYKMVPVALTPWMAYFLPWLELVCAAVLLLGPWRRESTLLLAAMLTVFTIAKGLVLSRGLAIECGCFSGMFAWLGKAVEGWNGVALNVFLLGLLAFQAVTSGASTRRKPRISVDSAPA